MYSEKENVLQLVALLKAHAITHIVFSPGSRNSPLIHSFATDPDFSCYSIVDERSAGFFALGIIQATQKPVAICCTSGTAVLNLGPAIAEAYYQQLPLLAISADRPAAWIGQMDGQTIPQPDRFQGITRYSAQLPIIHNSEDEWYCNRLINEAILALDNRVKGPVHINIPLAEPLFNFKTEKLPQVRVIRYSAVDYSMDSSDGYVRRFNTFSKRMIVVGQIPPNHSLAPLLERLQKQHGVVVLAEQLSNLSGKDTLPFDTTLYVANEKQLVDLTPDLIISIGGHLVSKRLKKCLRDGNIKEHWHISAAGLVVDTFQRLTDLIRTDEKTFLYALLSCEEKNDFAFIKEWKAACNTISEPKAAFSDLQAVGRLIHGLDSGSSLQLGNSNSVRLAQLYTLPSGVQVFCNRGTNGIDGSLSTAIGYATVSGKPTFLLIGDLSFFYDMNGLWNHFRPRNLRILLNNNGGGEIFHALPGLNQSEVLDEYIAASHQTDAKAWANQQGFHYLAAHNEEELEEQLPTFFSLQNEKPVLLEVFTSIKQNIKEIQTYYHKQRNKTNE